MHPYVATPTCPPAVLCISRCTVVDTTVLAFSNTTVVRGSWRDSIGSSSMDDTHCKSVFNVWESFRSIFSNAALDGVFDLTTPFLYCQVGTRGVHRYFIIIFSVLLLLVRSLI